MTFAVIWIYKDDMMMTAFKTPEAVISFFRESNDHYGNYSDILLLFLAVFDYAYQRYDYEKNMRMSKQDIKDEYKNMEGDPLIKSKIKERQRQMATRRMMSEVPHADVIITNPTHLQLPLSMMRKKLLHHMLSLKG